MKYSWVLKSLQMLSKTYLLFLVLASIFLKSDAPVFASFDYRYDSKQDLKVQYESGSAKKITRGIVNTLLGWTEIVRTPIELSAGIEHGLLYSTVVGIPYGFFRFVRRTLVGVYEIATFYVPQSPILPSLEGTVG